MNENPTDSSPGIDTGGDVNSAANIYLTTIAQQYLTQTRPWVRFLSVMTYIGAAFMALMGVVMASMGIIGRVATVGSEVLGSVPGRSAILGLIYIAMAIVYIAPAVFLSRYAGAIKSLELNRTAQVLEDALKHQKSFWRYVGILSIIAVIFAVAMFVFLFAMSFFIFLRR